MLSLLNQLQRIAGPDKKPTGPGRGFSVSNVEARNLAGKVIKERQLDAFARVMRGKGEMTSREIAAALGREITSINISLRTKLVPQGYVVRTRSEARKGGLQPRYYYIWNEDRDHAKS